MAISKVFSTTRNINKKTCTKCGIEHPLEDFHKDNRSSGIRTARTGRGVQAECRTCHSEARKPGLQKQREFRIALMLMGFKQCGKCKKVKPFRLFHKRVASNDGRACKCVDCVNTDTAAWRREHPRAHAEWYEEHRSHKSDYFKMWRAEHVDSEPARMADWAKKNPHKVNANIAKRRATVLKAIPRWADHKAIADIYDEAARLRRITGERYEVDHIVPLQGKTVCGLHWEGNLQILLKAENISKHNRRWPGMR